MSAFWDQLPEFDGPGGRFAQRYQGRPHGGGGPRGGRARRETTEAAAPPKRAETAASEHVIRDLKRALARSCHPDVGHPSEKLVRERVFKTLWPILDQQA